MEKSCRSASRRISCPIGRSRHRGPDGQSPSDRALRPRLPLRISGAGHPQPSLVCAWGRRPRLAPSTAQGKARHGPRRDSPGHCCGPSQIFTRRRVLVGLGAAGAPGRRRQADSTATTGIAASGARPRPASRTIGSSCRPRPRAWSSRVAWIRRVACAPRSSAWAACRCS